MYLWIIVHTIGAMPALILVMNEVTLLLQIINKIIVYGFLQGLMLALLRKRKLGTARSLE